MAERARRKLQQARYHLQQAEANIRDREQFTANLEAFIPVARSVLHVLAREVRQAGVWSSFEAAWNKLDQDPLLMFFRDIRNVILKEGQDTIGGSNYSVHITDFYQVAEGVRIFLGTTKVDPKTFETTATVPPETPLEGKKICAPSPFKESPPIVYKHYLFGEGALKDQDVISNCREYLKKLEQAIVVAEKCGA